MLTLWFDVGNGRYTTPPDVSTVTMGLWFDVGNGRYTTERRSQAAAAGCGLM